MLQAQRKKPTRVVQERQLVHCVCVWGGSSCVLRYPPLTKCSGIISCSALWTEPSSVVCKVHKYLTYRTISSPFVHALLIFGFHLALLKDHSILSAQGSLLLHLGDHMVLGVEPEISTYRACALFSLLNPPSSQD